MIEILFWHGLQQGPILDSFKEIVHEWNVEHSSWQVKLQDFTDYGEPAKQALSKAPEDQPSLVLAPEYMTSAMMGALKQKKVLPISDLLDQELLAEVADIVKFTFGDREGNLYSLPLNPSCGVLFTNKNILKAAGKDPNYIPKTMEELENICKELVAKGFVDAGYTCAWPAAYVVEVPAAQQNLPLVIPDNGRQGFGHYCLNSLWLKKHFFDLRKQVREGVFLYAGKDNNAKKPFIERKVAFFMQGSTHHPALQKDANSTEKPFEVGCGPLPTLTHGQTAEKYAFPLGGASIWVMNNEKTTQMIQGVRAFLSFLGQKDSQEFWHKQTAYVPVRKSFLTELQEFYQDHPLHQAVVEQTIGAVLGKYSFGIQAPNYAEARKEIFNLIEKVVDLKISDDQIEIFLEEFDMKFSLPSLRL